jgi:hypothetical protein
MAHGTAVSCLQAVKPALAVGRQTVGSRPLGQSLELQASSTLATPRKKLIEKDRPVN